MTININHSLDKITPTSGTMLVDGNIIGPSVGMVVTGGSSTTSDLTLKTTSGVGTTGADMHFLVGNNGATEAITVLNSGSVGLGTSSPQAKTHISSASEQLRIGYDGSNYYSTTVSSTGSVTFNAVGSGASFSFSDSISAGISTATTTIFGTGTTSTISADGSGNDVCIALIPKGAGAIQTDTTSNARGSGAVDLQLSRNLTTQVASGILSVLIGGQYATASGDRSVAIGAGGGATGTGSILIGQGTLSSGTNSLVIGGYDSTASGSYSSSIGGITNEAIGNYSVSFGISGKANLTGEFCIGADHNGMGVTNIGTSILQLTNITSNNTQTELFLSGSSFAGSMVLPNNSSWYFEIKLVARRTDTNGESTMRKIEGGVIRDSNAASTAIVDTVIQTVVAGESDSVWPVVVDADTTNGSLRIRVTGESGKTIVWLASVTLIRISE